MNLTSRQSATVSAAARRTRLVVIGSLSAGAAFAAVTGVASASAAPSPKGATAAPLGAPAAAPQASTSPSGKAPAGAPKPGAPHARGRLRRPSTGTITAIGAHDIILRTLNGTETVDTSATTHYHKEMQSITRGNLAVGDVVHVLGKRVRSAGTTAPSAPGTGTVDARQVIVVEPTFFGRVVSDNAGTFVLAGRDGQLLTVKTTSGTRYYHGRATSSASAIAVGSRVMASGTRTGVTSLSADIVRLAPAPGAHGPGLLHGHRHHGHRPAAPSAPSAS